MGLEDLYYTFLLVWAAVALVVFFSLFYKTAPYGRYHKHSSSFKLPSRLGWIVMESPTVIGILLLLFIFQKSIGYVEVILCIVWLIHYIHRSFIWPFRAKLTKKKMNISIVCMAFLFNVVNVSIQGIWIFILGEYAEEWLKSPIFIIGLFLFLTGMYINIRSDNILMNLREENGDGYHTPKGFLFKYISCPNYLGELIEWLGWAVLTLSPSGFLFLCWTFANLVPRAKSNHEWSKANITNYPDNRKSIFPFIY